MVRFIPPTLSSLAVLTGTLSAQQAPPGRTIQGAVMDTALRPLAGAMVYLDGQPVLDLTDSAGVFTLPDAAPGDDVLQVRMQGFRPRSFRLAVQGMAGGAHDVGSIALTPGPGPVLAIGGTVVDSIGGQPVVGVQVLVNGQAVARTDAGGAFRADSVAVEWGMNTVAVRRVGYAPQLRATWIEDQQTDVVIEAVLSASAVELSPLIVEGERLPTMPIGRLREFWRRKEVGLGAHFSRADIEQRQPLLVSDMLRLVPGVQVTRDSFTTTVRLGRQHACTPQLWIDGRPLVDTDLDVWVWPEIVEAIEVYKGPAQTPVEYARGGAACGAILVWTR